MSYSWYRVEIVLDLCHKRQTDLGFCSCPFFIIENQLNAAFERAVTHKLLLLADKPLSFQFYLDELDSFNL